MSYMEYNHLPYICLLKLIVYTINPVNDMYQGYRDKMQSLISWSWWEKIKTNNHSQGQGQQKNYYTCYEKGWRAFLQEWHFSEGDTSGKCHACD